MSKKVLIITYYWPPSGGPGVQRPLKFARYLPDFGWEPIILTVRNGEYPAIDESLEKDIPPGCKVYKTKVAEPSFLYRKFTGMKKNDKIPVANLAQKNVSWKKKLSNQIRLNLFVPDAKIGWIPYAFKQGKKIIEQEKPDIIFSTSPPPTVHLIAKKLAKWSGIKWVADFRDPWTNIHYLQNQPICSLSKNYNKMLEANVIEKCDKATCVSQNFVDLLTTTRKPKFNIITNGFDHETDTVSTEKSNDKFTMLYIGGLTWNRYFKSFFVLLIELIQNNILPKNNIKLVFTGSIEKTIKEEIEQLFTNHNIVEFNDYIPHTEAVTQMKKADLLLLFLEKVKGYEGHIPGKIFEYISTHNQILGIGNTKGESSAILNETKTGKLCNPENSEEIKQELIKAYTNWEKGIIPNVEVELIDSYSRKKLTKKLAKLFESML
uniref:glycosyltransferase family 4 protein n=1 Tax=uncultured Draconibacterium sp. TaxID=1573823 RepID=UPI0032162661